MKTSSLLLLFLLFLSCTSIPGDSGSALKKILKKDIQWLRIEQNEISMHYPARSITASSAEDHFHKLKSSCEKAEEFMGISYPGPVNFVLVDDNETVKFLTGLSTNGITYPYSDCVVQISGVSSSSHEVFHLMSINSWGMPDHWISEGMAVHCDGNWWGYELHALSKHLLENDLLPDFPTLTASNKSFRSLNSVISYPVAGSVAKFIDQEYGRDALRELWKSRDPVSSTGKDWLQIESEWKALINTANAADIHYVNKLDLLP